MNIFVFYWENGAIETFMGTTPAQAFISAGHSAYEIKYLIRYEKI